jgi:hypothetical protein
MFSCAGFSGSLGVLDGGFRDKFLQKKRFFLFAIFFCNFYNYLRSYIIYTFALIVAVVLVKMCRHSLYLLTLIKKIR